MTVVRSFLALQTVVFAGAALVHAGVLISGYEHSAARTAESVIGLVLLLGLVGTIFAPQFSRGIALGAQGFALAGHGRGNLHDRDRRRTENRAGSDAARRNDHAPSDGAGCYCPASLRVEYAKSERPLMR